MCTFIMRHYLLAHLHKYTLSFPANRHISQVNILWLAFGIASNSPLSPKEGCCIQCGRVHRKCSHLICYWNSTEPESGSDAISFHICRLFIHVLIGEIVAHCDSASFICS